MLYQIQVPVLFTKKCSNVLANSTTRGIAIVNDLASLWIFPDMSK